MKHKQTKRKDIKWRNEEQKQRAEAITKRHEPKEQFQNIYGLIILDYTNKTAEEWQNIIKETQNKKGYLHETKRQAVAIY